MFKISNQNICLLATIGMMLVCGPTRISACQNGLPTQNSSAADRKLSAAVDKVNRHLDKSLLVHEGKWYVAFSVTDPQDRPEQPSGFAPLVIPNSEAPPAAGIVEISDVDLSAYELPSTTRQWQGEVSIRLKQYRIYRPETGWSPTTHLLLHFWTWECALENSEVVVRSKIDKEHGTTDGGPTEFVASLFGLKPDQVECKKLKLENLPNLGEHESRPKWRARYGN